jgi:hypothetical protein
MVPHSDGVTVEVGGDGAVEIRAIDVDPDGLEAGEYVGFGQAERRVIASRDQGNCGRAAAKISGAVEVALPRCPAFKGRRVGPVVPPECLPWPAGEAAVLLREKSAFQANPRSAD